MSKGVEELREHLFDAIQQVKDGKMKPAEAKAVIGLSQTVINSSKIEIEMLRVMGGKGEVSNFVPFRGFRRDPLPPGKEDKEKEI